MASAQPQPQQPLGVEQLPHAKDYHIPQDSQTIRMWVVVIAISLSQGIVIACNLLFSFIYKDGYHFEPAYASFISSLVSIPWTLKPIWGVVTDSYPIIGYRRKSYLLLTAIVSWIGLFNFGTWLPPFYLGFICLICINFGQSFQSVVGQAVIVENAQNPKTNEPVTEEMKAKAASKGISVYFGGRLFGQLIFSLILSFILENGNYGAILFVISFVPVAIVVFSFFLPEKRIKSVEQLLQTKQPAITDGREEKASLRKIYNFMKHPLILSSWLFIFMNNFVVVADQTSFFYYTNYLHFTPASIGNLKFISVGANILGVILYYKFFTGVSMKKFYSITLGFIIFSQLALITLYMRWNLEIGVSDYVLVILDTFVAYLSAELNCLPILILAVRLCPKGMEATIYAVMIAGQNLALISSGQLGALIADLCGITSTNFDNLWVLAVINACVQLISLYMVWTVKFEDAVVYVSQLDENLNVKDPKASNATDEGMELVPEEQQVEQTSENQYVPPPHAKAIL